MPIKRAVPPIELVLEYLKASKSFCEKPKKENKINAKESIKQLCLLISSVLFYRGLLLPPPLFPPRGDELPPLDPPAGEEDPPLLPLFELVL
jgi:hypothetical protein